MVSCKQSTTQENEIFKEEKSGTEINSDSIINNHVQKEKTSDKILQLNLLISANKPEKIVLEKHILEENEKTVLDFHYPVLNEDIEANYSNFNRYITMNLVKKNITLMRENEEFIPLCDSIETSRQKSKINYAIKENRKVLSTVFVIENFYSQAMSSNVSFETVNYDLDKAKIINFEDYFKPNSEQVILTHLNKIITSNIDSGEMYYDCWEISEGDFNLYKNNYIIDGDLIRFYFNDCVVCPSYTGTYYIETTKDLLSMCIEEYYLLETHINHKL